MTWSLRMLELWLYRRACRILVLLPLASRYIVPLGISRERIHWLPNGVDLSQYRATDTPNRSRDDCFTLMYFGGHGQANALDNLLQAMFAIQQNSSNPRIILRLIGDGPLKPALMSHARSIGLANVCFEPSVGKSEIPKLATQADAFVISIPNLPNLYRFGVSPNKLFDYFAAGRPIIIAGEVGNNPVTESNAGFCVPPEKPNELAKAVMQMARTPALERHRMGRNAREYVERNHEFSVLAKRMAEMLDSVVVVPGSGERAC